MEITLDWSYKSYRNLLLDLFKTHKDLLKKVKAIHKKIDSGKAKEIDYATMDITLSKLEEVATLFYTFRDECISKWYEKELSKDSKLPHSSEEKVEKEIPVDTLVESARPYISSIPVIDVSSE